MGNQVHCTQSHQRHQPRILICAGGFTQPSGWLCMAWPRSAQTTKFAVPNWFVILGFCSEIWVTRSIALILTSDISRGFWFWLVDFPSRLAGCAWLGLNWFVILGFCSEIWVTRSIALILTSDISRG